MRINEDLRELYKTRDLIAGRLPKGEGWGG
jgi:hypothetical protein